jgi:hypothetical protein
MSTDRIYNPGSRHSPPRAVLLTLMVLISVITGAVLRLIYFDQIEFGMDGVTAILTTRFWLTHGVPLYGQMSGASVMMPPGFIFLLYPLVKITSAPLTICFYITAFNIAALPLIYRLGVEIGRPRAGLWACAFMAVHPWLIIYSRMIWPQCMLPFFIILLMLVLAHSTRCPGSRIIFWSGPLVSLIWQIHYSAYCILVFFLIWFVVSAYKRRIRWLWAFAGFLAGFILFFPHLYFLIHSNFQSIRQAFEGGLSEPVPLVRNAVNLIIIFGETSFAGGFGFFFQGTQFVTKSLAGTPLGTTHLWLAPLGLAGTLVFLLLVIAGLFVRMKKNSFFIPWVRLLAILPILLYLLKGVRVPPWYFLVSLPSVLMLAGLGMDSVAGIMKKKLKGAASVYIPILLGLFICISGGITWITFLSYIKANGGTGGMYGLTYRVQLEAAERLVEEGIRLDRIDADLTRAKGFGIFYLYDSLDQRREPGRDYSQKKARVINTYLYPDEHCGEGEEPAGFIGTNPLKTCLSPLL